MRSGVLSQPSSFVTKQDLPVGLFLSFFCILLHPFKQIINHKKITHHILEFSASCYSPEYLNCALGLALLQELLMRIMPDIVRLCAVGLPCMVLCMHINYMHLV